MLVGMFSIFIYVLSMLVFVHLLMFPLFPLQDKSSTSNLKIEALVFTRLVLASHAPPVFHPYIKVGNFLWSSVHRNIVKMFNDYC